MNQDQDQDQDRGPDPPPEGCGIDPRTAPLRAFPLHLSRTGGVAGAHSHPWLVYVPCGALGPSASPTCVCACGREPVPAASRRPPEEEEEEERQQQAAEEPAPPRVPVEPPADAPSTEIPSAAAAAAAPEEGARSELQRMLEGLQRQASADRSSLLQRHELHQDRLEASEGRILRAEAELEVLRQRLQQLVARSAQETASLAATRQELRRMRVRNQELEARLRLQAVELDDSRLEVGRLQAAARWQPPKQQQQQQLPTEVFDPIAGGAAAAEPSVEAAGGPSTPTGANRPRTQDAVRSPLARLLELPSIRHALLQPEPAPVPADLAAQPSPEPVATEEYELLAATSVPLPGIDDVGEPVSDANQRPEPHIAPAIPGENGSSSSHQVPAEEYLISRLPFADLQRVSLGACFRCRRGGRAYDCILPTQVATTAAHLMPSRGTREWRFCATVAQRKEALAQGCLARRHGSKALGKPVGIQLRYTERPDGSPWLCCSVPGTPRLDYHSPSSRALDLRRVTDIYLGKQTAEFRRHASKAAPEAHCFALLAGGDSLCLEMPSVRDRVDWVVGILEILREVGVFPLLHRTPLWSPDPPPMPAPAAAYADLELSVRCARIPSLRHNLQLRKVLVQLYLRDEATGVFHLASQTEKSSPGDPQPRFLVPLRARVRPGARQVAAVVVSYSKRFGRQFRLGWAELELQSLLSLPAGSRRTLEISNPSKKTYHRMLQGTQAAVVLQVKQADRLRELMRMLSRDAAAGSYPEQGLRVLAFVFRQFDRGLKGYLSLDELSSLCVATGGAPLRSWEHFAALCERAGLGEVRHRGMGLTFPDFARAYQDLYQDLPALQDRGLLPLDLDSIQTTVPETPAEWLDEAPCVAQSPAAALERPPLLSRLQGPQAPVPGSPAAVPTPPRQASNWRPPDGEAGAADSSVGAAVAPLTTAPLLQTQPPEPTPTPVPDQFAPRNPTPSAHPASLLELSLMDRRRQLKGAPLVGRGSAALAIAASSGVPDGSQQEQPAGRAQLMQSIRLTGGTSRRGRAPHHDWAFGHRSMPSSGEGPAEAEAWTEVHRSPDRSASPSASSSTSSSSADWSSDDSDRFSSDDEALGGTR